MPAATGAEALPDFRLRPDGEVASGFAALGLNDFRAAARHVRDLPYGRNSDRSDYGLVLDEARGTCSTKHAILAVLAREHEAPVELKLGIYLMNGRNTPGVGPVLSSYRLDDLPEAHCYLVYRGRPVDLTGASTGTAKRFLYEETIEPDQIGAHKAEAHRAFLRTWAIERGLDPGFVWQSREECIAALSEYDGA